MKIYDDPNRITNYQAMVLIFSCLAKQSKHIIHRDYIVPYLYSYKTNEEVNPIFYDICIKKNIDSVVSQDISDALLMMNTFGVTTTFMPDNGKIINNIDDEYADEIINDWINKGKQKFVNAAKIIADNWVMKF